MSAMSTAVHDFPWVHRTLGLVGNVCFVVGSVFYLFAFLNLAGTWLFIVGSTGMLVG